MTSPKIRFKVDAVARENGLGGCVIMQPGRNLILVEGGTRPLL